MTIRDGGPAFPRPVSEDRAQGDQPDGNRTIGEQSGMTLRDYFAGQAIAGFVGSPADFAFDSAARMAYDIADAMIVARNPKR